MNKGHQQAAGWTSQAQLVFCRALIAIPTSKEEDSVPSMVEWELTLNPGILQEQKVVLQIPPKNIFHVLDD